MIVLLLVTLLTDPYK